LGSIRRGLSWPIKRNRKNFLRQLPHAAEGRSQPQIFDGAFMEMAHGLVSWLEGLPEGFGRGKILKSDLQNKSILRSSKESSSRMLTAK